MDVPAGHKVDVLFVWRPQDVLIQSDVPAGHKVDVLFVWRPQDALAAVLGEGCERRFGGWCTNFLNWLA